jgi:hypothetical protein|tara:strand:+ start:44 stop:310 length:267 start_codon:yes stop_codon:yes gene_type:complete
MLLYNYHKTTIRSENEMNFEELSREFEKLWVDLCAEGENDPLACAGIMMAQAMRIYKSMLTENEFNMMVETILKSRPEITTIEKPTIN